jgi:hypothetical protein
MLSGKKIIIIALIVSLSANVYLLLQRNSVAVPSENTPVADMPDTTQVFAFLHTSDTVQKLSFSDSAISEAPTLPEELIIAPGHYGIGDKIADMRNEGLYRFIAPPKWDRQVIVYRQSLLKLLGSISWIVTHGNSDNKKTNSELSQKAKTGKLYLTCGYITPFAKHILDSLGFKTRTVTGSATTQKNGFDDGHVLLEVFDPMSKQWMLVDLDNNLFFTAKGSNTALNLLQVRHSLAANELQFHYLSADVATDVSGFKDKNGYSYGLYAETLGSEQAKLEWYRRVLSSVCIDDVCLATATKAADQSLDSTAFAKKFY